MIYRMANAIQPYPWGSRDAMTELYGIPNETHSPMAELWMGAHPKAPSVVQTDDGPVALDELIASDPAHTLGGTGRLPFLFKILAAAQPLSIQSHPSRAQARSGYAREEAAGIPIDAPERNYRDDNHKPELICAIRTFWGLRGFRRVDEIRRLMADLPLGACELPDDDTGLGPFFAALLRLGQPERAALTNAVVSRAVAEWPGDLSSAEPAPDDLRAHFYWVRRIAEVFPGDIGIVAPMILNVFCLRPGEATYQPAGVLHAYLEGVGAELMANSDNVLRGGLTGKHIDVDELLATGVFRGEPPVVLAPRPDEFGTTNCTVTYVTPFDEFELVAVSVADAVTLPGGVPQVVFGHEGALEVSTRTGRLSIARGESVFVTATARSARLTGRGVAFVARTPV